MTKSNRAGILSLLKIYCEMHTKPCFTVYVPEEVKPGKMSISNKHALQRKETFDTCAHSTI